MAFGAVRAAVLGGGTTSFVPFVYFATGSNVTKFDMDNNEIWSTVLSGTLNAVATDPAGFVYAGGTDASVTKLDPDGNVVWVNTSPTNTVRNLAVDRDGFVYSADQAGRVRKYSPTGTLIFTRTFGTFLFAVDLDDAGNIYVGNSSNEIRKYDNSGTIIWTFTEALSVTGVRAMPNGDVYYWVGGTSGNNLRKRDTNGNLIFSVNVSTFGSNRGSLDLDGNFYSGARGVASSNHRLVKVSSTGTILRNIAFGDTSTATLEVAFNDFVYRTPFQRSATIHDDQLNLVTTLPLFCPSQSDVAASPGRVGQFSSFW